MIGAIIDGEEAAQAWLTEQAGVSRETMERLALLSRLVLEESEQQNLIARSTADSMWQRHIVDSAQLLTLLRDPPRGEEIWLDLGTGAGFPGLVIALMAPCRMILVESRARRVAFLQHCVETLDLADRITVAGVRLERLPRQRVDYISARAFAPLEKLLSLSARFSTEKTHWLLPKGRNARSELESLSAKWQSVFHVKQSLTDPDAQILVGRGRA